MPVTRQLEQMLCPVTSVAAAEVSFNAAGDKGTAKGLMYPLLENYINSHMIGGSLTAVKLHRSRPLDVPMLYYSSSSRYCMTAGREHQSNHVMVHVNVLSCYFREFCLDPDCLISPWRQFDAQLLEHNGVSMKPWHDHWLKLRMGG